MTGATLYYSVSSCGAANFITAFKAGVLDTKLSASLVKNYKVLLLLITRFWTGEKLEMTSRRSTQRETFHLSCLPMELCSMKTELLCYIFLISTQTQS